MIKIDGVTLPTPSVYKVNRQDLDSSNSGRNELGYLIRDRLRQGMLKGEFEWWGLDNNRATTILNAVSPSKVSATLLVEGKSVTVDMYVSDRSSELIRYMGETGKMAWTISFSLVEY